MITGFREHVLKTPYFISMNRVNIDLYLCWALLNRIIISVEKGPTKSVIFPKLF